MVFIIIETKDPIQSYKNVILDIISKSFSMIILEETTNMLIIQSDYSGVIDKDIFLGLASELYADLRVYISANEPLYSVEVVEKWLKMIPFTKTVVYDDRSILLKRVDYPTNNELKKIVLKTVYEDNELLYTIKTYLEANQNTSQASRILYLHRNTLIQRLDKFYRRTGLDCRSFVDAYIIYTLLKN